MLTSSFEWFIEIIHFKSYDNVLLSAQMNKNIIFGCQYMLIWRPHELCTIISFTYWKFVIILKQPQ